MPRIRKQNIIHVALTDREMKGLSDLADRHETNKTAVMRAALRLYRVVAERAPEHNRFFIETEDGKMAEIVLLSLLPHD